MIRTHEANSAWWGQPVGLVTDAAFFARDRAAQQATLRPFAWAEFKAPLTGALDAFALGRAGFVQVDVQMPFRIALRDIPASASLAGYECRSAMETPFTLQPNDVRTFEHERFLALPGVTPEHLNQRYVEWANQIVIKHPATSLCLTHEGRSQGWFFAETEGAVLHLTLGMLAAGATVSGQHLYHAALQAYARGGANLGYASFSVRNTAVLNIYARLGAKFTTPTGVWLWRRPD